MLILDCLSCFSIRNSDGCPHRFDADSESRRGFLLAQVRLQKDEKFSWENAKNKEKVIVKMSDVEYSIRYVNVLQNDKI